MKINIDAQMCLKKLEYVGVLNFATVGLDGSPQVRCISAIHYEPDALHFFTAEGKAFCEELLADGRVQIMAYTRYKEMIRVTARRFWRRDPERKKYMELIFAEQPYLADVYPGDTEGDRCHFFGEGYGDRLFSSRGTSDFPVAVCPSGTQKPIERI